MSQTKQICRKIDLRYLAKSDRMEFDLQCNQDVFYYEATRKLLRSLVTSLVDLSKDFVGQNDWNEIHLENQHSGEASDAITLGVEASYVCRDRSLLTRIDLKLTGMVIEIIFVLDETSRQHLVLPKEQLIRFLKALLLKFSDADWGIDCWMPLVQEAPKEHREHLQFH